MDVKELDQLCIDLIELEKVKADQAAELKETNKKINSLQFKLSDIFQELEKTENSGDWGKVAINVVNEFKAIDEDAVYDWLKAEGRFDDLSKIHAGTLKKVIKEETNEKRLEALEKFNSEKGTNYNDCYEAAREHSLSPDESDSLFWLPSGTEEKETIKVKVSK